MEDANKIDSIKLTLPKVICKKRAAAINYLLNLFVLWNTTKLVLMAKRVLC